MKQISVTTKQMKETSEEPRFYEKLQIFKGSRVIVYLKDGKTTTNCVANFIVNDEIFKNEDFQKIGFLKIDTIIYYRNDTENGLKLTRFDVYVK